MEGNGIPRNELERRFGAFKTEKSKLLEKVLSPYISDATDAANLTIDAMGRAIERECVRRKMENILEPQTQPALEDDFMHKQFRNRMVYFDNLVADYEADTKPSDQDKEDAKVLRQRIIAKSNEDWKKTKEDYRNLDFVDGSDPTIGIKDEAEKSYVLEAATLLGYVVKESDGKAEASFKRPKDDASINTNSLISTRIKVGITNLIADREAENGDMSRQARRNIAAMTTHMANVLRSTPQTETK